MPATNKYSTDYPGSEASMRLRRAKMWKIIAAVLLSVALVALLIIILLGTGAIPVGTNECVEQVSERNWSATSCLSSSFLPSPTTGKVICVKRYSTDVTLEKMVDIIVDDYGTTAGGERVYQYTFRNQYGMEIQVINYGVRLTSIWVPDRNGHKKDVSLGLDDLKGYEANGSYFGAVIGRVANRIAEGEFTLDGTTYQLEKNNGNHHLHGGIKGWGKLVWAARQQGDMVVFSHMSPDGDENYPGQINVNVTVQLTNHNEILITFNARASIKATPINLSSHAYFNLAGEGTSTIYDHEVQINADRYTEVTDELIPTGRLVSVDGSVMDLRQSQVLHDVIFNVSGGGPPGFDHNFCVQGPTGRKLAARVHHPGSGRTMEVYTDQPGLQFYTGNFLNNQPGKHGGVYNQHTGFCLETQNYPDAINHVNFPDSVLRPGGSTYHHQVWYKFYTI